jgi:pyruvate dehydrogenase E1 component alpha subunit
MTSPKVEAVEAPSTTRDQLLHWYRQMTLIRRFEELAAKAYTQRKIQGFCHLYIGQEAVAVGASAAIRPDDTVVSAYRVHGHILARGAEPRAVMAELFGKAAGVSQGVGGSMHMASAKLNFYGGYGIVGGHIPLAIGAAFAARYRGEDKLALVYFGDGAAQQGAFFESMAIAQLWKLPVVFLLENNYYAMGTSLERQSYLTDLARRGDGVGMVQWQIPGFDVVDVFNNVSAAAEHARSGKGPVLLEAITYRYRGHSMSDPAKYRKAGELEEKKKQDALHLAEQRLISDFAVAETELAGIRDEADHAAKDAYEFADGAPEPDPARLYDFNLVE